MNKPKSHNKFWFLLLSFFMVTMCRTITTITVVHPDGSMERTIRVSGDSSDVFDSTIPLPDSENWSVIEEGESDSSFVYAIHGTFRNDEALNREFAPPEEYENLPQRRVEVEKRFGWFYSFITYREIYPQWNGFTAVPLEEYFSDTELQQLHLSLGNQDSTYMSPEDSTALQQKFDTWMQRNYYEEIYELLKEIVNQEIYPGLTPDILEEKKEAMWETFRDSVGVEGQDFTGAITAMAQAMQNESFNRLLSEHQSEIDSLEEKLQSSMTSASGFPGEPEYTWNDVNVVEMPGLILDTNSDDVEGNRIQWDTDSGKYFVYDYEMWVTSRVVNVWAIWVSGVLLILIIAGVVFSFIRPHESEKKSL